MHELSDVNEQMRIIDAGYCLTNSSDVLRVYNPENPIGGLNMSRSIGDFTFKSNLYDNMNDDPRSFAISNEPECQSFSFSSESQSFDVMLMGCDGIWDGTMLSQEQREACLADSYALPEGH